MNWLTVILLVLAAPTVYRIVRGIYRMFTEKPTPPIDIGRPGSL